MNIDRRQSLFFIDIMYDNLCYLKIKSDTGQHLQFLRCFLGPIFLLLILKEIIAYILIDIIINIIITRYAKHKMSVYMEFWSTWSDGQLLYIEQEASRGNVNDTNDDDGDPRDDGDGGDDHGNDGKLKMLGCTGNL